MTYEFAETFVKDGDKYHLETNFVDRNIIINDRVKMYFKGKWFSGTVIDKYFKDNNRSNAPLILVKTDNQVSDDKNSLLNGYGLEGKVNNMRTLFEFEDEKKFGDKLYHKKAYRDLTPEEIAEHFGYNEFSEPPFTPEEIAEHFGYNEFPELPF